MMKITEKEITDLLADKHYLDVFVNQCKDGPTQGAAHRRLDAWAMKKTWCPVTFIGYEVKISRTDFMRDDKWPSYLPLCHQLYFVCPHGLIAADEMPDGVGLIWTTKNGRRLRTKKRAQHRDIEIPGHLLVYILMCRAKINKGI